MSRVEICETLSVLLGNFVAIFCHVLCLIFTFLLFFNFGVLGQIFLSIYLIFMLSDLKSSENASRGGSSWFRSLSCWRHLAIFFPIRLIKTVDLPPTKNYLFAAFPHGLTAFGYVTNFGTKATNFEQLFPGIRVKLCTLPIFFLIPFYREIFLAVDMISVKCDGVKKFLMEKPSNAAVIVVGGAREAFYSTPRRYKILIKNRKGFVRLALETGASLVPVFSFGEVDSFQLPIEEGKKFSGAFEFWTKFLLRYIKIGFFHFLPNKAPINTVVGAPIDVEKVSKPSQTEIDELHRKFMKELEKLFDEHKKKFLENHQEIKLEMV